MMFRNPRFLAQLLLALLACVSTTPGIAQNAIVTENLLPGTPPAQWDVSGIGDASIQGFATDISYVAGDTARFKVRTDATAYSVDIYRLGYYQGNGARLIGMGTVTATLPQTQPADLFDSASGLVDCGNWVPSAEWQIPPTAVSGIYIARLTRTDNQGASHMIFVVRDDSSHSDLLFQTSDATWHAYNSYGGNTFYLGNTSYPSGHATRVSYNRPMYLRQGGGGTAFVGDGLFNAEYPMVRWLEANGYDVTYTTNVDSDRRGELIRRHPVFLSVGHDEYWSGAQRAHVTAARDAGVHLAFFSGNEVYWKTRWEPSLDAGATPFRTLVCYKEGTLGENVCGGKCDPLAGTWTGLWRSGCEPGLDACSPENTLSGQISWRVSSGTIAVPSQFRDLRFWRNTSVASLANGQVATLTPNSIGYEWDFEQYFDTYPPGRIVLSETFLDGRTHRASLYRHAGLALVFGAGTVQWSWGLDGVHERGGSIPSTAMRQATVNLFADMGVQPGSLQPGLVTGTASTDSIAPASTITSPTSGADLLQYDTVTLSGTAGDTGGGVVAGVEISVDGGATWRRTEGGATWSFTWTPNVIGSTTIMTRSFDDSGNLEQHGAPPASNAVTIMVRPPLPPDCPCTIFPDTPPAVGPAATDGMALSLGVRFRVVYNGYIHGIRYWKAAVDTGAHIGQLWSASNSLLAEAAFADETASGWQQVLFETPVPVSAGVTYVATYHSATGWYSASTSFFTSPVVRYPLRALADGEDGASGVYAYSETPVFPNLSYRSSNYWVDVVFDVTPGDSVLAAPMRGQRTFTLAPARPNPFTRATLLAFDLSHAGFVRLDVFDIGGRRVRTLLAEGRPAGRDQVTWDGRDDHGRLLGSGMYLYRLRTGREPAMTRRMVLMP